jgi:hypothetical protein
VTAYQVRSPESGSLAGIMPNLVIAR